MILTHVVQDEIVVELDATSDDPTSDILKEVAVVVGLNAKTGAHERGHEMLLEPRTVLDRALLRLGTVFRQRIELAPALNRVWTLVELHCVRIGWLILDIAMYEIIQIAEDVFVSVVDIPFDCFCRGEY